MDGTLLSVTTALVGLLAVSGRTVDVLWDLNSRPQGDTAAINQALHGVRECRSSIHVLYKTLLLLESAQLAFPARATWVDVDQVLATLTDTVLAFTKLYSLCEAIEGEAAATATTADLSVAEAAACARHAPRVRALSARIRFHNLSMTMILTILQCPGESDARRSRAELAQRITRLLTSNTPLSGRLRGLEDVFHAKPSLPPPLPNYAAAAQSAEPAVIDTTPTTTPSTSSTSGPASLGGEVGHPPLPPRSPPPPWSTFSGLTLMDISVLSMVALPVTLLELGESLEFYTFAVVEQPMIKFTDMEPGMGMDARTSNTILGLSGESWDNTGMVNITRPLDTRAN